ncbi:hypothetical protein GGF40_002706, partial [Coemansia sp. RSA 1286]
MESNRASSVFRSVWNGQDRLVGTHGRFRTEIYVQKLETLDWRSLGSLLTTKQHPSVEENQQQASEKEQKIIRCLVALSVTLSHMQTVESNNNNSNNKEASTPVNSQFVTKVFSVLMQATKWVYEMHPAEYHKVAHFTFKALSAVLASTKGNETGSRSASEQRFAYGAVLDGVLGRGARETRVDMSSQGVKKRRVNVGNGIIGHADFLKMMGSALSVRTDMRTDKYVVRILRLRSGAVIGRILGTGDHGLGEQQNCDDDADVAKQLCTLVGALATRCSGVLQDSLNQNDVESDEYVGGLFACVRDILPLINMDDARNKISLVATDQLLALVAQLAIDLASLFRPLVLSNNNNVDTNTNMSVYSYCTQKRHRCYQWAALCRVSTWLSAWGMLSAASHQTREGCAEAIAESGRVCWLQCFSAELYLASAEPSIWLLVLSESLHHMALDFPHLRTKPALGQPPFTLSDSSQTLVFALVAALLSAIGPRISEMVGQSASMALFLDLMVVCDKIVCLVRPQAASMGLFEPQNPGLLSHSMYKQGQDSFKTFVGTPPDYICRPVPLTNAGLVGKSTGAVSSDSENSSANVDISYQQRQQAIVDDSVVELQREAFEEIVHETRIAGVFSTLDKIIDIVASFEQSKAPRLHSSALSMSFRVALRWLNVFTTSARNNVNHQTSVLDGRKRVNIRLVGDRVRLNKSATDWSRLQRIPILRIDSRIHPIEQAVAEVQNRGIHVATAANTDADGDMQHSALIDSQSAGDQEITYGPMVSRVLRFLTTISVFKLLADGCQSTLERCLVWQDSGSDSSDETGHSSAQALERTVCLCKKLHDLLSEADFDSSAFHALQIISSIVGVRSHLYTSDIMELRMPHTYLRNHSPRSSEALLQMAMGIGLCRLLLEPTLLVRSVEGIRSGKLLLHPRLICTVQIWLDMIGNIARHSLFRSYMGIGSPRAVAKSGTSCGSSGSSANMPTPLIPFAVWWSLALSASTRCMADVLQSAQDNTENDWKRIRMLLVMPSHLMSWHLHVPMTEDSVRQMSCLNQGALQIPARYTEMNQVKSDIGQLFKWLALFTHPERSKSIIHIVYYLATRLWLDVPLLNRSNSCEQSIMRISKDIWGIACDSLQFLIRLIQQSTPWQDFVELRLVEDFAQILKMLFTRQGIPSLVLSLTSPKQSLANQDESLNNGQLSGSDSEAGNEENSHAIAAKPVKEFAADDIVGRLLHESSSSSSSSQGRSADKNRVSSSLFSKHTMAKLWSAYIDNLLRFPVTVVLTSNSNKILDGSAPLALFVGGSGNSSNSNGNGSGGVGGSTAMPDIKVNIRDWLCDKGSIPFDMFLPLLDAKQVLSRPNAMWSALEAVFPIDEIVWAINGVERDCIAQACMSAALVLPDISSFGPRAPAIEGIVKRIFILATQRTEIGAGSDVSGNANANANDNHDSRCTQVLLYVAWRQRSILLQKLELCAAQLKSSTICVAKQLGSFDLTELAAFGLKDGLLLLPSSPKIKNSSDLILFSGNDRGTAQPPVTTSIALLVEHSPVFAVMLTGGFSEAQTVREQQEQQLTLQSSHNVLTGLFDIFHRLALLPHPTPDAQCELEIPDLLSAFALEVNQKHPLEDQAAMLDMAAYYELRPAVVFLIWNIISQTILQTASGAAFSTGVLEILAAMYSEEWGPFFKDDVESVCSVQRSLSALLLLYCDKIDLAG